MSLSQRVSDSPLNWFAKGRQATYYWLMTFATPAKITSMPIVRNRRAVIAKWIFGRDAFSAQQYVMHAEYPAFFAKIGQGKDGLSSPFSHVIRQGLSFYDFVWLDPFPGKAEFLGVMHEAEMALDAHLAGCRPN